ncbi:hypothetical protein [Leifsonia sp. Leaf264]|uniref:hypothetical protein n=1 Tax=Leifsonia sp. Leaf264 TaxID=1736314 RepID=UPI0006FC4312|nr:hypothetical protein [Leifsonia sp. Leaf264]KQO98558.1 hypothetical protein ASF30_10880 [Leifsonia sp. Leaf264]
MYGARTVLIGCAIAAGVVALWPQSATPDEPVKKDEPAVSAPAEPVIGDEPVLEQTTAFIPPKPEPEVAPPPPVKVKPDPPKTHIPDPDPSTDDGDDPADPDTDPGTNPDDGDEDPTPEDPDGTDPDDTDPDNPDDQDHSAEIVLAAETAVADGRVLYAAGDVDIAVRVDLLTAIDAVDSELLNPSRNIDLLAELTDTLLAAMQTVRDYDLANTDMCLPDGEDEPVDEVPTGEPEGPAGDSAAATTIVIADESSDQHTAVTTDPDAEPEDEGETSDGEDLCEPDEDTDGTADPDDTEITITPVPDDPDLADPANITAILRDPFGDSE